MNWLNWRWAGTRHAGYCLLCCGKMIWDKRDPPAHMWVSLRELHEANQITIIESAGTCNPQRFFFTVNSIGGVGALRISACISITVHFRYTGHRLSFFLKKFSLLNEVIFSVPKQDLFLFNYFIYFFFNPKSLCGSVQDWPVSFIIMFSGTLIQSNPCFPQPTCTIKKLRSPCFSSLTNILQQNDFRTPY